MTQDLLITDCTFLHGHGCSIGSETYSGLRNLTVRRCTFEGTDTGVRLKNRTEPGAVWSRNVTYTDLTMKNVGTAISISSYYQSTTNDSAAQLTLRAGDVQDAPLGQSSSSAISRRSAARIRPA